MRNNGCKLESDCSIGAAAQRRCTVISAVPMPEPYSITVNGKPFRVAAGTTVAAAILNAGEPGRVSVQGEPRGPLCGMGICMECRATVNGAPHARTCQMLCVAGMEVLTEKVVTQKVVTQKVVTG